MNSALDRQTKATYFASTRAFSIYSLTFKGSASSSLGMGLATTIPFFNSMS